MTVAAVPGDRLRRDVAWNLVPVVLLGVVGLGLSFAIAKFWGAAAFGVFNLVSTIYFTFATLGACGLQFAVLRAIAEQPDDRDRVAAVVAGALVPAALLGALATAAFLALRPAFARWLASDDVVEGMTWAAPALFCFTLNKVVFGVVNGLRRMRAFAVYTSLRYVLIAAGLAIAYAVDLSAARLPGIWTLAEAGVLLALVGELVVHVRLAGARGWPAWTRRHLGYGVRGVLATLAYELNSKLDVWMVGVLVASKADVGVYALAGALNEGVAQLSQVLQNNLDPVIARSLTEGDEVGLHALVRRTRRWFVPALAGICALAAACFPLIIPWLIGDVAFAAGALPFALLMLGVALASPMLPFAHVLLMARRPGWHTVLLVTTIAINAAGCTLLIPLLGIVGAAASTAIALVTSVLILRFMARRIAGVTL